MILEDIYFFGSLWKCLGRASLSLEHESTLPGISTQACPFDKRIFPEISPILNLTCWLGDLLQCDLQITAAELPVGSQIWANF